MGQDSQPATLMTVLGPMPTADMGVTLTHEHIINDVTSWTHRTESLGWEPEEFARLPVSEDILWDLRQDPFANLDNCRLDDRELAATEVGRFGALGGSTILEATGLSTGRDLSALRAISERTGVSIVAGTGYYLDAAMPEDVKAKEAGQIADLIVTDLAEGEAGIRPGD